MSQGGDGAELTHRYWPDERSELAELAGGSYWRVLVVGEAHPELDVGSAELRAVDPSPEAIHLSNGCYRFVENGGTVLMIVRRGKQPREPEAVTSDVDAGHWMMISREWMYSYWGAAQPSSGRAAFDVGETVCIASTGEYVHVLAVHRLDDGYVYRVMTQRGLREIPEGGLKAPEIDVSDPQQWIDLMPTTADRFATHLTITKLANPLTDTVYSFQSSKTIMQPYQFKPVLKLLNSTHQRLLIADEVGLGKTIEAGLVWSELEARHEGLHRVLVVCPASLTRKWQDEMRRRFDRRVPVLEQSDLAEFAERLSTDEPDGLVGIVSLERLRASKSLVALNDLHPQFDLIIVDEAHYLRNRSTKSFELGEVLCSWAHTLLFLSATPLNLGTDDLFNLLNLLVPEEFADRAVFPKQLEPNEFILRASAALSAGQRDPGTLWDLLQQVAECELGSTVTSLREWSRLTEMLNVHRLLERAEVAELQRLLQELNVLSSVVTRTRKVDVPVAKAVRSAHSVRIEWQDSEARLYNAVRQWAEDRARRSGISTGFATQMPLRQAASCLPAVVELVKSKDPRVLEVSDSDDFDDVPLQGEGQTESDDDTEEAWVALGRAIDGLIVDGSEMVDSKFQGFLDQFLTEQLQPGQRVLLFSFFRRTLSYLYRKLSDAGFTCEVLDGGVPMDERPSIMQRFRDDEFQILLCSEVGSEGLDFEFCDVVVNYDLPWNPMRVEQRIGRLDRFGQEHEKITVLNFAVPGTIETDIFDRLYSRIRVFEQSIGELEPILRDEFTEIAKVAIDPTLTAAERELRLEQIEIAVEQRRNQLDELADAETYMAGLDQLMIDGFERDTTSRGRYLGPRELRHLLEEFLSVLGSGRLEELSDMPDRAILTGGGSLGDEVAKLASSAPGSNYSVLELARLLRDGEPLVVTFSNEDASKNNTELISLRHPVIRAAVRYLSARSEAPVRFASIVVDDLPDPNHSYLTLLCMADATGLRKSLELWPVTIDLNTGEFSDDAGFALLAATARHAVATGPEPDVERLRPMLHRLIGEVRRRNVVEQETRASDNDAMVDARLATRRAGITHRLRRSELLLADYERTGKSERIRKLQAGMIRNFNRELELLPGEMNRFRGLTLSVHPIAVALVSGRR